MNIVLLTTARGQRPEALESAREQLGLTAADHPDIRVVGWHPPRRGLPVTQHVVLGPDLSLTGRARYVRVAPSAPPGSPDLAAGAGEAAFPSPAAEASPADLPRSLPPVYHPRRVAKAVAWRARRIRKALRKPALVTRVRQSTKVRKVKNKLAPGGLATQYAIGCLRAAVVHDLVERADVVVAMDANTHRAAWLLARRHPGPAVVVGLTAGRRVLDELRERDRAAAG